MKYFIMSLFLVSTVNAEEAKSSKKNRIRYIVSAGVTGLTRSGNNVELEKGPVFGIGYERKFDTDISVGVQVHTNGQTGLSIGLDF